MYEAFRNIESLSPEERHTFIAAADVGFAYRALRDIHALTPEERQHLTLVLLGNANPTYAFRSLRDLQNLTDEVRTVLLGMINAEYAYHALTYFLD